MHHYPQETIIWDTKFPKFIDRTFRKFFQRVQKNYDRERVSNKEKDIVKLRPKQTLLTCFIKHPHI